MAGLFGDFFSDPMAQISMGLLAGQSPNFGVNVGSALLNTAQLQAAQNKVERENRASDLQQIAATYKILKDQDQMARRKAEFMNEPYTPDPLLALHEQKMAQLMGSPSLSGSTPRMVTPPPSQPQQAPQQSPGLPPAIASQYSSAVRPEFQAQGPMPQPQAQQPQAQSSMRDLLKGAGIDPRIAVDWASTPAGTNELYKKLSDVYAPRVVNNVLMQLNPDGTTRFLGGAVGNDTVPVVNGPNGLAAQPIQGLNAARAAQTTAQEEAKAPFTFQTLNTGPGGAAQTFSNAQLRAMTGGTQQPASDLPQSVIDALRSKSPTSGTYDPRTNAVNYSQGGGGLTAPNPVNVAADKAQAEDLAKFHATTFIETQQAGKAAAKGLQNLDRIDQLMKDVSTGKLTPAGMTVSAYAQALGIPIDPKLPNKQAAEALTAQMALELRNPAGGAGMPGALSDNDLKFLRSMTPGMAQTTEGRALIIESKRKTLQRDQEVAQLARDYRSKNNGRIDDGFLATLQTYADSHPLFPQAKQPSNSGWSVEEVK